MIIAPVSSRLTRTYQVVPADLERDAAAIVDVWSRNFLELSPEQHRRRFEWNYCSGPYGPGWCWLLLAGETVVGTAGLGVRRLQANGAILPAGLASDLAVDVPHRSLQPALMLQKAVLSLLHQSDLSLIYGLPNRKSVGVFRRLRYSSVARIRRFVKVLRVDRYLEQRNSLPPLAQRLVAAPANLGMKMASAETWRKPRGHVIREIASFDRRFDDLFSRTQSSPSLSTARSAEFLKWRYAEYPLLTYTTIGLLTPDEARLAGYAILYAGSQGQVVVVDFWNEPNSQISDDLMGGVVSWARRNQAASIAVETYGGAEFERALRRLGFSFREEKMELLTMPSQQASSAVSAALNHWYFVSGDEDYN